MKNFSRIFCIIFLFGLTACSMTPNTPPSSQTWAINAFLSGANMSFFVTSVNPGSGGNLRGLTGADAYCKKLATAVGAGDRTWHAYLSTTQSGTAPWVNARDRIGKGPWYNARWVLIAENIEALHSKNALSKDTSLDERGTVVLGRGDVTNNHDIITGSLPDGSASGSTTDTTCGNWTTGSSGSAIVGHHDRIGINDTEPMKSWNSSHATRGCSLEELKSTGGAGLFYCFAE